VVLYFCEPKGFRRKGRIEIPYPEHCNADSPFDEYLIRQQRLVCSTIGFTPCFVPEDDVDSHRPRKLHEDVTDDNEHEETSSSTTMASGADPTMLRVLLLRLMEES